MATSTARLGLVKPEGTDDNNTPLYIGGIADILDAAAIDGQGLIANRPVSTPGSPGKTGRYYYATDEQLLYRDHGTGWKCVAGTSPEKTVAPQGTWSGSISYTKQPGLVTLRGTVQTSNLQLLNELIAGAIAAGDRPIATSTHLVVSTVYPNIYSIYIDTSGNIKFLRNLIPTSNTFVNDPISLDGITYRWEA